MWVGWSAGDPMVGGLQGLVETAECQVVTLGARVSVVPGKWTDALLAAAAAGEGYDVGACAPYGELIVRGAVAPITELVASSKVIERDDFLPGAWNACTYQGKVYGVPGLEGGARLGLCWNKRMFERADLDPEKPPFTWEEAYAAHERLTRFAKADDAIQIGLDPYDAQGGWLDSNSPWAQATSWGIRWFDEQSLTFNIDAPAMVEAWETLNRFMAFIGPDRMAGFRQRYAGWTNVSSSIVRGTQAMQINGYWAPSQLSQLAPDPRTFGYSWLPVPEGRSPVRVQVLGSHCTFIPTISRRKDLAFRFAEFTCSPAAARVMFDLAGALAPRRSLVRSLDPSRYPGLDWFIGSIFENDELQGCAFLPTETQTMDTWQKLREKVMYGQMTAEAAVREMQADCTRTLRDLLAGGTP